MFTKGKFGLEWPRATEARSLIVATGAIEERELFKMQSDRMLEESRRLVGQLAALEGCTDDQTITLRVKPLRLRPD